MHLILKWQALKRLLKGILLSVLLLFFLIIATAAYFSATTSGLRQLITLSQRWLPGELQVQKAEGTLLDSLHLQGVSFRHPDFNLSLQRLYLDWQPDALFSGTLHIGSLELNQPILKLTTPATATPPSTEPVFPISLPDITLPLQLQIDTLQLLEFAFHPAATENGPATPLLISSAQLKLHTEQHQHTEQQPHTEQQTVFLDNLEITAPQGSGQLYGQLSLNGQFPLKLTTRWEVILPDNPALQGSGTLQGSVNELNIEQQLSGVFNARLTASLQRLLDNPQGTLRIDDTQIDLGLASPQLSGHTLSAKLHATGNLQGIEMDGNLQANLPEIGDSGLQLRLQLSDNKLHIEQLQITQANTEAEIQLRGDVTKFQEVPQFDLKGSWSNLRYPFQEAAEYRSPAGQLQLSGNLKQYQLELTTTVAGTTIPAGHWTLKGSGNDQGLKQFTLSGNTLEGELLAEGQINWQPGLSWQVDLSGQQLDPGLQWQDWPGKLDFHATSSGIKENQQPVHAKIELDRLTGNLREQPLEGNAQVELTGTELAVHTLQLTVAGAKLAAKGILGDQLDMNWSLDAPNLDQLPANVQGALSGSGSLRGPADKVHLIAKLQGNKLQLDNHRIAMLDTDLDIDLSGQQKSTISLNASQLNLAGNSWQQLAINGQGTPAQHQLQLALSEGLADLKLQLNGSWDNTQWLGTLSRADLQQDQLGLWQLQRPVPILASASDASLKGLCLERLPQNSGELCVTGSWSDTGGILGDLDARRLSLEFIEPWMPPGIQMKGQLQANASFQQPLNERPKFQASASIQGTELLLEEEDINIIAREITLNLNGQQNRLIADLQLPLQQPAGDIQARLSIDDLDNAKSLDGALNMQLSELKFISLLTPQLQAISGKVESAMTFSGSVDKPRILGHLRLVNGSAELPELGIKLDAINLALTDQPGDDALRLEGSLQSGEGSLKLNGEFDPLTKTGQFMLDGERFQAAATEEIQAWISPAIKIDIDPELITLKGEINIPEANITPPKIDSVTPISPDVVILDPNSSDTTATTDSRQVINASLRFTLGDKVEVEAVGFKGLLQGSVLVEDDGRRATRASGSIKVAAGQYQLYGQNLDIDRGSLLFTGGPVDNPGVDLQVSRIVDEVTAGAKVRGTLKEPRITLFSDPAMSESSLLSFLLFGRAPGADSNTPSQQELLFKAVSALTMKGGNAVAEEISDSLRVDDLGIEGDSAAGETSLYIGKYLSPRLYVKYGVGLLEPTNTFFVRYQLSKRWSLETESGTDSSGGDIIYTLER